MRIVVSGHVETATSGLRDSNPAAVAKLLAFSHSTKSGQPNVERVSLPVSLLRKCWTTKLNAFSERLLPLMNFWDAVDLLMRSFAENLFLVLYWL